MAYFPNATSGYVLDRQCGNCPLGSGWNNPNQKQLFDNETEMKPCPVAFIQMQYNYDQLNSGNKQLREAMTQLIADDGECRVRKLLVECRDEGRI